MGIADPLPAKAAVPASCGSGLREIGSELLHFVTMPFKVNSNHNGSTRDGTTLATVTRENRIALLEELIAERVQVHEIGTLHRQ